MVATRIIPPDVLPVSLEEFRQHLWNIFDNQNTDDLLTGLLQAATDNAEGRINRKLINQTWSVNSLPVDSSTGIVLPFSGFQSLAEAAWFDGLVWTPLDAADIEVDDTGIFAVVYCTWPDAVIKKIRVDWVCGYGPDPADVPGDIRMAIKQLAASWYRSRSATSLEVDDGRTMAVPFSYSALLHSYRLNLLG